MNPNEKRSKQNHTSIIFFPSKKYNNNFCVCAFTLLMTLSKFSLFSAVKLTLRLTCVLHYKEANMYVCFTWASYIMLLWTVDWSMKSRLFVHAFAIYFIFWRVISSSVDPICFINLCLFWTVFCKYCYEKDVLCSIHLILVQTFSICLNYS